MLLAFVVLLVAPATSASAQEIVMATWGGAWGKAFQESMIEPFEKATGVKVRVISGVSSTNLAAVIAQKDRPQVDVITMVQGDALAAWQRGVTEALEVKDIPALNDLTEVAVRRDKGQVIFAGMWTYPMGIIYRTDKITWPLKSWADLWDPRLKNKVAVTSPKYSNSYFLAMINRLAGGTENNADPGFAKIKTLGANLLADVADDVTPGRLLASGEIWAVPMLSGTAYKVIEQGVPAKFVIPEEGAPAGVDVIALVKGAPHAADAKKFINYVIGQESLTKTCEILKLTPLNRKVTLSPETAKRVIAAEEMKRLVVMDDEAINRNKAAWLERWSKEISPMTSR
jgi:putative spermidine/putrescine transport system substrate-binding protein